MSTRAPGIDAGSKGLPLHVKVLIGFLLGAGLGLLVHFQGLEGSPVVTGLMAYLTKPFGQIFLNLLFMLVIPLMFSALVLGVAELGDIASLGRLGWKTLIYTAVVTGIAVGIGLLMVNLIQPGLHMDPALVNQAMSPEVVVTIQFCEPTSNDCSAVLNSSTERARQRVKGLDRSFRFRRW